MCVCIHMYSIFNIKIMIWVTTLKIHEWMMHLYIYRVSLSSNIDVWDNYLIKHSVKWKYNMIVLCVLFSWSTQSYWALQRNKRFSYLNICNVMHVLIFWRLYHISTVLYPWRQLIMFQYLLILYAMQYYYITYTILFRMLYIIVHYFSYSY